MENFSEALLGTWRLASWKYQNESGDLVDFFGENPTGILIYDASGYMSVQIFKDNRMPFESGVIYGGSQEEAASSYNTYFAYFGKFEEVEPGMVKHLVEGALFPNWLNKEEIRYGKIEHGKLTYSTPPTQADAQKTTHQVSWQKVI
ncbi:MAG: lipocalin-like domain-containing protein [Bacteroidota bacterium]